jgi:oligopeptide/dipeptide ABC transporter ATP-binding protein
MHAGVTVEQISAGQIDKSRHPYTRALYDSRIDLVEPRGKLATIKGQPPAVGAWPSGCRFADRCDYVKEICRTTDPVPFIQISDRQMTACIKHDEIYGGKK